CVFFFKPPPREPPPAPPPPPRPRAAAPPPPAAGGGGGPPRLADDGHEVLTRGRDLLDLRDGARTEAYLRDVRPDAVVLAAAKVGGIMANSTYPVQFLEDNLRIQLSVIAGAHAAGTERLLFLGSSCIYPRLAPQPIREESLLTGELEPTNEAYALAKIAGIVQTQSYRRQYGASYISAMPTNLYGPGDNFDLETSHVLPALIRRFHEAQRDGLPEVTLWGSGSPRREFLHVDDLAAACVRLLEAYDGDEPVNIGCGEDLTIRELAETVAEVTGFQGRVGWDTSKPDGTPRKLLDVSRLTSLGFKPQIPLRDGIARTYAWWLGQLPPAA
ncbi:GDP-L-fucose synthase family protein, partial [Streptomyces rhizosphaericola]|uniref:GDP-L-fucose synthase family protein n=1 Tax=Streptomyces rhizosphaericola TaxID=2564098 RepID=UPI003BF5F620